MLRSKESLLDYRFTPEPDLPPLVLTAADVEAVANRMPELPNDAYRVGRSRRLAVDGEHHHRVSIDAQVLRRRYGALR